MARRYEGPSREYGGYSASDYIRAEIALLEARLDALKLALKDAIEADREAGLRDLKAGIGPLGPEYLELCRKEEAILQEIAKTNPEMAEQLRVTQQRTVEGK